MPIEKIDLKKCTGCGICVESCPMDVIRFNKETLKPEIMYPEDCIACFNCEQDCPVKAIYVDPHLGTHIPPAW